MKISNVYSVYSQLLAAGQRKAAEQAIEDEIQRMLFEVTDLDGLRRVIDGVPDWAWESIRATLNVPEGTFKSPLLEAAYNAALAAIVGMGRCRAECVLQPVSVRPQYTWPEPRRRRWHC